MFILLIVFIVLCVRLITFLPSPKLKKADGYTFLIVLGSGGHTTEMLKLLKSIEPKASRVRITFVVADTDSSSIPRISSVLSNKFKYQIKRIPRIRSVGESILIAFFRIPLIFLKSAQLALQASPDAILVNGPGTCIPIVFTSLLIQYMMLQKRSVVVFIESFCRTKTISLTGRILYNVVDSFILQWKPDSSLQRRFPRARYLGTLI